MLVSAKVFGAIVCFRTDLWCVLLPCALKVAASDDVRSSRYAIFYTMQVSTPLCGILIFHARQLARCACWRAVHLREVHTFRSIETEFANFCFSFRDSNSPSVAAKGPHGSSGRVAFLSL